MGSPCLQEKWQDDFHEKVAALYLKRTHKFGTELHKMVKEAVSMNNKNGNIVWQDAIEKEMENAKGTF